MQTSKIVVGDTYAVRVDGSYVRFRVKRINTVRNSGGTSSTVHGEIQDRAGSYNPGADASFEPGEIEGPYDQFAELAEKRRKEKEAQELKAKQEADRAEAIFTAFCKLIGVSKPKKVKQYGSLTYSHDEPFRLDYSNNIEIKRAGMEILAAFFKVDQQQQEAQADRDANNVLMDNIVNLKS